MNSKATAIVSYITWVGLIVSIAIGEKDEFSRHHINQAFMLWLIGTIGMACLKLLGGVPVIGAILNAVFGVISGLMGILCIVGIITAILGSDVKLPIIGGIKIF